MCSHAKALYYWAESVKRGNQKSFVSVNRNYPSITNEMGNNCPKQ